MKLYQADNHVKRRYKCASCDGLFFNDYLVDVAIKGRKSEEQWTPERWCAHCVRPAPISSENGFRFVRDVFGPRRYYL
jgi:hypothetical protein